MTGAQLTSDLIERGVTDITAGGKENRTVLGVQFFDGGAAELLVAFAKDLLQIAQQDRFDSAWHDRVPVPEIEAPRGERCARTLNC
jgi:hypothetical protein